MDQTPFKETFNGTTPLYRQLMDFIIRRIHDGVYSPDALLPSLNEMTAMTGISKETVIKAYQELCKQGILNSQRGKGYYVNRHFLGGKPSVLVIMDKFSAHGQVILEAFMEMVSSQVEVTVLMHYQDLDRFEGFLNTELDKYDYYLVFPHFPVLPGVRQAALELIRRIPPYKLILMDRYLPGISPLAGASYQSLEEDVATSLTPFIDDLRKYRIIRFSCMSVSLYGELIGQTLKQFCQKQGLPIEILSDMPERVEKGDLYFLSGSRLDNKLVTLADRIADARLTLGKDVGIICYNDWPLNKLILGGLTTLSTDFVQMGREAAKMVLSRTLSKVHCHCRLIRRNTF